VNRTWKLHAIASAVVVVIAVVLSAIIWFSSTAGYAKGGILDGADLRKDIIILCWLATGAFVIASSLVVAVLTRPSTRRAVVLSSAYLVASGVTFLVMRIADRYM
jgi:hypothetical protein